MIRTRMTAAPGGSHLRLRNPGDTGVSELEVETEADGLRVEVERGGAPTQRSRRRGHRVEAVVEVLEPGRQIGREHVLDAAARRPADVRVGKPCADLDAAVRVPGRIVDVRPGDAGRSIEQRAVAVHGDASPAAHGADPVEAVLAAESRIGARRAAVEPGAGEVGLGAEHVLTDLDVVTDLPADERTAAAVAGGDAGRRVELPVDVRPAVADVGADVEAGPRERGSIA